MDHRFTRRQALQQSALGFGSLALAGMLAEESFAQAPSEFNQATTRKGTVGFSTSPAGPLAPRQPHFAATARRLLFLFMHGGVSQDTLIVVTDIGQSQGGLNRALPMLPQPCERVEAVSRQ